MKGGKRGGRRAVVWKRSGIKRLKEVAGRVILC